MTAGEVFGGTRIMQGVGSDVRLRSAFDVQRSNAGHLWAVNASNTDNVDRGVASAEI